MINRQTHNFFTFDSSRGFTLVEILVAITIFAIAVSMLFTSFNIVISQIHPINASIDQYEMAQTAMKIIEKDLMSLYVTGYSLYSPPDLINSDTGDRFRFTAKTVSIDENSFSQLRFASLDHINLNRDSRSVTGIIKYYTQVSEDGTIVLKRYDIGNIFYEDKGKDETAEDNNNNDPVICENVKIFEMIFIDQEGNTHEDWDSDSSDYDFATPFAVRIKLVIGNDEQSNSFATTIVLPVFRKKHES